MPVTLSDLTLLRFCGVAVDNDLLELGLAFENVHMNLGACWSCAAVTGSQHARACPWASILVEPDWYERVRGDEHDRFDNFVRTYNARFMDRMFALERNSLGVAVAAENREQEMIKFSAWLESCRVRYQTKLTQLVLTDADTKFLHDLGVKGEQP